jgi:hypothetical protein
MLSRREWRPLARRASVSPLICADRTIVGDPAELVPEVVQRAAEIHAREGAPPDGAFVMAFTRELIDRGYLDPDAVSTAGAMARDKQGRLRQRGDDAIAAYRSEWYPQSMENSDRCDALLAVLQQQGPFTLNEAMMAFWPGTPTTNAVKERVAIWLRAQLRKVRKGNRLGEHPVRRHKALSKLVISDIVITMLEAGGPYSLGGNVLQLLEELLDVDRYRATLDQDSIYSEQFIEAAEIEAEGHSQGKPYGVRELAKLCKC